MSNSFQWDIGPFVNAIPNLLAERLQFPSSMSILMFTTVSAHSQGFCKALLEFCWTLRSWFIKDSFSKGSEIPKFERFHLVSLFNLGWGLIFKQTCWKCLVYVSSSLNESIPAFGWMFIYSFLVVTLWLSRC